MRKASRNGKRACAPSGDCGQSAWDPDKNIYFETIFTQSNGYMGIRGYTEENETSLDCVREGYLAGVFAHTDGVALKQMQAADGFYKPMT